MDDQNPIKKHVPATTEDMRPKGAPINARLLPAPKKQPYRVRYKSPVREKITQGERRWLQKNRKPTPDAALIWFQNHCLHMGIKTVPVPKSTHDDGAVPVS